MPQLEAVRTQTHLYVEYQGGRSPELFDLVEDPREMRNLIGTAEGEQLLPRLKKVLGGLRMGRRY